MSRKRFIAAIAVCACLALAAALPAAPTPSAVDELDALVPEDGLDTSKLPQISPDDVDDAFERFDTDSDGELSLQELVRATQILGLSLTPRQLAAFVRVADRDGDLSLTSAEFMGTLRSHGLVSA